MLIKDEIHVKHLDYLCIGPRMEFPSCVIGHAIHASVDSDSTLFCSIYIAFWIVLSSTSDCMSIMQCTINEPHNLRCEYGKNIQRRIICTTHMFGPLIIFRASGPFYFKNHGGPLSYSLLPSPANKSLSIIIHG